MEDLIGNPGGDPGYAVDWALEFIDEFLEPTILTLIVYHVEYFKQLRKDYVVHNILEAEHWKLEGNYSIIYSNTKSSFCQMRPVTVKNFNPCPAPVFLIKFNFESY